MLVLCECSCSVTCNGVKIVNQHYFDGNSYIDNASYEASLYKIYIIVHVEKTWKDTQDENKEL